MSFFISSQKKKVKFNFGPFFSIYELFPHLFFLAHPNFVSIIDELRWTGRDCFYLLSVISVSLYYFQWPKKDWLYSIVLNFIWPTNQSSSIDRPTVHLRTFIFYSGKIRYVPYCKRTDQGHWSRRNFKLLRLTSLFFPCSNPQRVVVKYGLP